MSSGMRSETEVAAATSDAVVTVSVSAEKDADDTVTPVPLTAGDAATTELVNADASTTVIVEPLGSVAESWNETVSVFAVVPPGVLFANAAVTLDTTEPLLTTNGVAFCKIGRAHV